MNAPATLTTNVAHGQCALPFDSWVSSSARATAPMKPPAKIAASSRESPTLIDGREWHVDAQAELDTDRAGRGHVPHGHRDHGGSRLEIRGSTLGHAGQGEGRRLHGQAGTLRRWGALHRHVDR